MTFAHFSRAPMILLALVTHPTLVRCKIIVFSAMANHFLLLSLGTLAVIVVFGLWLHRSQLPSPSGDIPPDTSSAFSASRTTATFADKVSIAILLGFVAGYICTMLYGENFSFYDGNLFTDYSLRAQNFPPPIWPGVGRFHPLFLQEFNFLRFITHTPAGYHALAATELAAVLAAMFVLLRGERIAYRVAILVSAALAPSFVLSFVGLPYAERNILLWLAIMLVCHQYSRSQASLCFVGCLVATHFILYYKETIVILVVGYAGSRIALDVLVRRRAGAASWRKVLGGNALQIGMLAIASVYSVFFVAATRPGTGFSFSYIASHQVSRTMALQAYLRIDWLLFALIPVLTFRLLSFLFGEGPLDLVWDSLACGAVAYFGCLIVLRMFSAYYTAPADLIAILYFAVLSLSWLSTPSRLRASVVAAGLACLLASDAAYSAFRVIEYKGIMSSNGRLSDFLRNYRPADTTHIVELFFPYADAFRMEELSAYLRYQGLSLVGEGAANTQAGPRFLFKGPQAFPENRCLEFKRETCVHAESAGSGALVVILPDDHASQRDLEELGKDSTLLLAFNPCQLCTRPSSWLRSLHAGAGYFWRDTLPEHWLQLHVFEKTQTARLDLRGQDRSVATTTGPLDNRRLIGSQP